MHHVCWIRNVCIVCIIDLVPRSWIAQLGSRCDPEKRKAIKEKGDTGMVKKTVSKTTNKKNSVEYSVFVQFLCWILIYIYILLFLHRSNPGSQRCSCCLQGRVVQHWKAAQLTRRPLQIGCWSSTWRQLWLLGAVWLICSIPINMGISMVWNPHDMTMYVYIYTFIYIHSHIMWIPYHGYAHEFTIYIYIVCLHHMGNKYIEDPLMLNWALDIEHLACLLGVYHIINQS